MKPELKVFRQFLAAQEGLKAYCPKDSMSTDREEIDYISKILALDTLTIDEMLIMRNFMVLYYEHLREKVLKNDDRREQWFQAMLSVTAVIDHVSHGETA